MSAENSGEISAGSNAQDLDALRVAADYPSGNLVTLICPVAAGGELDIMARIMLKHLRTRIGVDIVVDSIPGAGTVVASTQYMQEPPNTDKLIIMSNTQMVMAPLLSEAGYGLEDFIPLFAVSEDSSGFYVRTDSQFETFEDLVEYGQENTIVFGSGGPTGPPYIALKSVLESVGCKSDAVISDSNAESIAGLLGGHVELIQGSFQQVEPYVRNGDFRPLISLGRDPFAGYEGMPETAVDNLAAKGIDLQFATVVIFSIRAGTDQAVVDYLRACFENIYADPVFRSEWMGANLNLVTDASREFVESVLEKTQSQASKIMGLPAE